MLPTQTELHQDYLPVTTLSFLCPGVEHTTVVEVMLITLQGEDPKLKTVFPEKPYPEISTIVPPVEQKT